jgi:hypothetical protein
MQRLARVLAVLFALSIPMSARADTWMPPEKRAYTSSDGSTRVVITPGASAHAMAEVFVGKQRVRTITLVNDVAPVRALIANGGRYLVTFDNWYGEGYGPDVIVIYGANGQHIRSLALEEVLPKAWLPHVDRSISSREWGHDHALLPDGATLELHVAFPGRCSGDPEFVPVRVRLSDGVVQAGGPQWEAALARVQVLERERLARWEALRVERAKQLLPPSGNSVDAWRDYLMEMRARLSDASKRPYSGAVLQTAKGGLPSDSAKGIAQDLKYYEDIGIGGDFIFVSPDSHALARVLARQLGKRSRDAMKNAHVAFVGDASDRDLVVAAAVKSGAQIEWIDVAVPVAGQTLPDLPD